MYKWVDVCLIFLTDSNVVSPGSNDGTHMCGNDGNDPPKKVQELEHKTEYQGNLENVLTNGCRMWTPAGPNRSVLRFELKPR